MLNLDHHITLTKEIIESPNICDQFSEDDLKRIGEHVWEQYDIDEKSREPWLRRNSAGMDLATQVQKEKTFPWPGCSNVAFPLITIAALQFHSRAYPALVTAPDLVKCRVVGDDPGGQKAQRAERVSAYMSWQLLEQDDDWETQQDMALLHVPIVGTAWKKSYYDAQKGYNESDLVLSRNFVVNYWTRSLETCSVKTHIIPMSKNMMHTRMSSGVFRDVSNEDWYTGDAPNPPQTREDAEADNRMGLTRPMPNDQTPYICLEQHNELDLDGDGYAEPYIVTIEQSSHCVLRIVCRFDREEDISRNSKGEIIEIKATEYFTKIPFIPNPDGSIYDIGFGTLLGPLNESTNSVINQLIDAGTMSNTAGGFLGRGAKIRGGVYNFSPFQWNRVDSTGDDLRKSMIPLPVRDPSNVLFQLLSLLINYTEKISGSVDITTGGNPGQNTPAQTTQTMVEQGQKVYAAIFKRMWRAMKQEFKKLYQLNGIHLPVSGVQFAGSLKAISRGDFLGDPSAVIPVADPNIMSDTQRFMQASAVMKVAQNNPLYNQDAVNRMYLKSLRVQNIDDIYLGMGKVPPPGPTEKVQIQQLKQQMQAKELEWKKLQWISTLLEQRKLNEAKIISLYAQAALYEKQAGGVDSANQVAQFQAVIDSIKVLNAQIGNQIQQAGGINGQETDEGTGGASPNASAGGGVQSLEGPPSDGGSPGMD